MSVVDIAGFEQIRSWLVAKCGITYADNKADLLRQRLMRVNLQYKIGNLNDLAKTLLRDDNQEIQLAVMHAASTNHTYFFREMDVLDKFVEIILPTLQRRPEIRIWSAAASTGDEAYTVAMLISEKMGRAALDRLMLLGTDISAPSIEKAETGTYTTRQLENVPPIYLQQYFRPAGPGEYSVNDEIRKPCTFRRMNLKTTPYPFKSKFQVVFCRNLLYYFNRDDQIATLKAMYDCTEPGGWLVTSVTEAIRDLGTKWEQVSSGIYRRPM